MPSTRPTPVVSSETTWGERYVTQMQNITHHPSLGKTIQVVAFVSDQMALET